MTLDEDVGAAGRRRRGGRGRSREGGSGDVEYCIISSNDCIDASTLGGSAVLESY